MTEKTDDPSLRHLNLLVSDLERLADAPPDDALAAFSRIKKKLPPAREEAKNLLNEAGHDKRENSKRENDKKNNSKKDNSKKEKRDID